MGIEFLSKRQGLFRRESTHEGNHWQMLEMREEKLRIVGLYAFPSASAQEWIDSNATLKRLLAKGGRMVIFGDLNASHLSWSLSGKIKLLQRR